MRIRYEGKVRGFLAYALPELRKCAMRGLTLQNSAKQIQKRLQKAQIKDLRQQILSGGPREIA